MEKLKNTAIMVILIFVFILTGTCIISIRHIWAHENYEYLISHRTYLSGKRMTYDTSNKQFHDLTVGEEVVSLYDYQEGSNIRIHYGEQNVEFIIEKYKDHYYLNVVCNHMILYTNMQLGASLEKAYFRIYKGYLMFYNEVNDGKTSYEFALFVNEQKEIDEFKSLGNEKMELTEEGILYYYDECVAKGNGLLHKVLRDPFKEKIEMEQTNQSFSWCE